jgi:hypothetical protein
MMDERLARTSARTVAGFGPDILEKSKTTTREATHAVQYSCMMVSKAAVDFSLELIDVAQENLNAAFDFARQLPEVKSPSIFFEVSATQVRKQFENLTRQAEELTDLAQKAVTDTAKCWQSAVESANQSANRRGSSPER